MSRPSDLLLVIEGGGSKGRAALAREGRVIARSLPAGLNPNDIDPDTLKERLEALILPLLEQCSVGFPCPTDLGSLGPTRDRANLRQPRTARIGPLLVLAALAGAGRPKPRRVCLNALRKVLGPRCSRLRLRVRSDAEALLQRFFTKRDGVVLIAGTGSICLGVTHSGGSSTLARAGGWGSYLDKGGGFRLGVQVLDTALARLDGGGPRTSVVDLLCMRYGVKLDQLPDRFLPIRRKEIAEIARVALEASEAGDPHARRLVREAVSDLEEMVRVVATRLRLRGCFDAALSGGLFENPHFMRSFRRVLKRKMPSATVIHVADPLACLIRGQTCLGHGHDGLLEESLQANMRA